MTGVNLLRAMPDRGARNEPFAKGRRGGSAGALLAFASWGVGLWAWTVHRETTRLARDLSGARQEVARLRPIVAQAEAARMASLHLQQRAEALEAIRAEQRAPMRVLGEIGRALPDDCWLTGITDERHDVVRIDGAASTTSSLFAFVERLQRSGTFHGGVEVLESHATEDPEGDLLAFSLKASGHPVTMAGTPLTTRERTPAPSGAGQVRRE